MEKITYEFQNVNIREIVESPMNAQVMKETHFKRLVNNIKKDGTLTSAVLLMKQDGNKLMCISGHHRIKAAKIAGIKEVPAMVINEISESNRIRLQLSHNDIHGEPNENLLMVLQQRLNIEDLQLVEVMEGIIKEQETFEIEKQEFYHTVITLLEPNHKKLTEILETINDKQFDSLAMISPEDYEKLKEVLTIAFKKGYKSPGQAFRKFLDMAEENMKNLTDEKTIK